MAKYNKLLCLSVIAALFGIIAPSGAQEIKLTLADQNPPAGWGPVNALQPWVKKVEAATKGRVKIEVFPSQTLVKGGDMWRGVRSGIADIGWCFHGYWPDQTPLSDVMTLPSLPFKSAEKGSEVLWKLYERFPAIQKEYSDIVPLTLWTSHPYFLLTTKKQVKTLDDLKGLKIRVTGGPPTEQMKALGAVPTPMPMPDVYEALDKGVIDGMGAPWEAVLSFRLYEVAKYYTMVPLSSVYFSLCANKQKWQGLPKEVRDQIMSVSGIEGARHWGKNFYDTPEQAVVDKAKAGNHEMIRYNVPDAEVERWRKIGAEPVWEAWVKKMEDKGNKDTRKILNTTLDLLNN